MKLVKFTRDFLPQRAGESRVLPDHIAQKLINDGDAEAMPSAFDAQKQPEPPKRGYFTKQRGRHHG